MRIFRFADGYLTFESLFKLFSCFLQSPAVKALIEPLDNRFSMPPSVSKYLESSQAPSLETCDGQTEAAAALALRDLVDMFGVAR